MKKIPLILILVFLCVVTARGQPQYTTDDSIPFMANTHLNDTLATWDSLYFIVQKNSIVLDTTRVIVETETGVFNAIHAPVAKGSYLVREKAWYEDVPSGRSWNFSVVDPSDFKYTGTGCESPTGANLITITTKALSDSSAIPQCLIQFWNTDDSQLLWWEYTTSTGYVSFLYNADTLLLKMFKDQYSFTIPETLFIDGNEDTTYYGSTSLVYPPQANLCNVYGWIFDQTNSADTTFLAKIENVTYDSTTKNEDLTTPLRFQRAIISPYIAYDNPDTTGRFCFDIYRTASLNPDTTWYRLTVENKDGDQLLKREGGALGILFQAPDTVAYEITW